MKTLELSIKGMTCGHCVMTVKKELSNLESVNIKSVEIGKAIIEYDEDKVSKSKINTAVESAGYEVVESN